MSLQAMQEAMNPSSVSLFPFAPRLIDAASDIPERRAGGSWNTNPIPSTHREDVLKLPNRNERVAIPASFAGVALASVWKHSGNFADRRVEPLEPLYNQV